MQDSVGFPKHSGGSVSDSTVAQRLKQRFTPISAILALLALVVVLCFCFPPWELREGGRVLHLGYGTMLGPREGGLNIAVPVCTSGVQSAQTEYSDAQTRWAQYQQQVKSYSDSMRMHDEVLKEYAARGLDPTKVHLNGKPIRPGEGPSETAVPFAPREPWPSVDQAKASLAAARESCNTSLEIARASARIDLGSLVYQLLVALLLGGLLALAVRWLGAQAVSNPQTVETLLEEVQRVSAQAVVAGFRKIGAERRSAPTSETSDTEIPDIHKQVLTSFRDAADKRGDRIPAGKLNFIVWKFLLVKEKFGEEFMLEHLSYEVQKYLREGLRPDYQQELNLI